MGDGDRVRVELTDIAAECPRCGAEELRLMRSRDQRAGLAVLNPRWDPNEKTYERCKACGFRRDITGAAEVDTAPEPRRVLSALGWTAVVLMVVLIAVLTVVLAAMLLVVSVWLAVAVPLVVLALLVAAAAYARRG